MKSEEVPEKVDFVVEINKVIQQTPWSKSEKAKKLVSDANEKTIKFSGLSSISNLLMGTK